MRNVERAKKIAADKGINISFVCREIGKSRGYISQMLTTDRDFPDEMLLPVANALGVTVDELTGKQSEQKEPTLQPQSKFEADMEWVKQRLEAMPADKRDALMQMFMNSVK